MALAGPGPRFLKIGGRVIYPLPEIEAVEAASLHANTIGPLAVSPTVPALVIRADAIAARVRDVSTHCDRVRIRRPPGAAAMGAVGRKAEQEEPRQARQGAAAWPRVGGRAPVRPNPTTWRTWASVRAHVDDPDIAGPGIMLGKLEDGRWLVGVDLDLALSPTTLTIEPWAQMVLDRCNTYAEISPSGAGIKLLGYARTLPTSLVTADSKGNVYHKGTEGTPPGAVIPEGAEAAGHKHPELGLYAERRFFTLTGRKLPDAPAELADITDAFAELVTMVNGWAEAPTAEPESVSAPARPSIPLPDPADMPEIVAQLLAETPELNSAWNSGAKLTKGKDQSGSGLDYSLMIWLAGRGWDDTTIEAALRAYPHGQIRRMDDRRRRPPDQGPAARGRQAPDRVARAREASAWLEDLICGKDGPLDNVANVCIALAGDPSFRDGIRFDELRACPVAGAMPWRACEGWREWIDTDDIALAEWLQLRGLNAKPTTCAAAVQHFAAARPVHPLRDHLDGLAWDGQPRLDNWLRLVPWRHRQRLRAGGWARLDGAGGRPHLSPGLQGRPRPDPRGAAGRVQEHRLQRHRHVARVVCRRDQRLGYKDSAQDLRGKWIIEIGELSAMRRSEVERIKAFISRCIDHYRPSYGRRSQDFPRSCVFIGTTNADTYLADETGGRRFWPVKVGRVDIEGLRRDIELLWAEAVAAFKAGEAWHLPRELEMQARAEQADRRIADPWEEAILSWAEAKAEPVTIADALSYGVGLDLDRRDQSDENRVARIFKAHGWERFQRRVGTSRVWHYRRPRRGPAAECHAG